MGTVSVEGLTGDGDVGRKLIGRPHSYSMELKRQVAKEYLAGARRNGLARRHHVSRKLMASA